MDRTFATGSEPTVRDDARQRAHEAVMADFRRYRRSRDRRLRDRLVVEHLGLARAIAWRYRDRGEDLDDLRQVAGIGLVKAVERFDPERGVRFSTFAVPTILGEVKRHFRDHGWTIGVPRRLKVLRHRSDRAREDLAQSGPRSPTIGEIADHLGEDPDDVLLAMEGLRGCYSPSSLDRHARPDLPDEDESAAEAVARRAVVEQCLARLEPRERAIVVLRFWGDLTQQEIADRVGLSQMHVSRLLRQSLVTMG